MTSAAPVFKAALFDGLTALYAADATVLVTYGPPGATPLPDVVVMVGDIRTPVTFPRGGPNRTRDEEITVMVEISASLLGGASAQRTCTERAYAVEAAMDAMLRAFPGENAGLGASGVYLALAGDHELSEDGDEERLGVGRSSRLSVQAMAWARRV